ncbi:glycoside hydrolase family 2 protein [Streptosporangium sp. 'caverna']|uniref:glycoside hydrolase family 2 protein n=1 Tax=Streptosporangium sp. 'caverna' TaxID=2202249 RepID=UPI001EF8DFBD|nr:glycoside hydrolase family 2 protein [Streptosporangium sp. 'caverna']
MRTLHDGWTLSQVGSEGSETGTEAGKEISRVAATVPGCVHTDLLAAGLIEDPYLDDNETRLTWIGRSGWDYETTFVWHADEHERTDLVCEGLDTVATVVLNGVEVAVTANQHRSYGFAVRDLLLEGKNTLRVRFASPYEYIEARRAELGDRPGSYDDRYQFIRKMACNFGWDWGPAVVTSGIWRPIGLRSWSGARLASVRPLVSGDGRVEVHVTIERASAGTASGASTGTASEAASGTGPGTTSGTDSGATSGADGRPEEPPLTVTASVAGIEHEVRLAPGENEAVLTLQVPDPELWWPRGYGEQTRYELVVGLGEETWSRRIGFRDVHLDRTDEAFTLAVNGVPVFVRGVNWIPDDCFPARVTRERLAERFGQALAANVNLLRVWGGGLYESEDFYDLADELGLLVWQDFPFACAAYPEEEPFAAEVEAEARENVTRLAWRPSLILWCGNNENIEGHADWGWQEELGERTWGAGFYYDLLPSVVAELDPTRPYWPGSPYSGRPDLPPRDPERGTVHIWDVWNREDYTRYAAYRPRFVAEFGFQGPPAYATLRGAVSDDPLTPSSPGVLHHQKAADGNAKLLRGLGDHLPRPETFDDWHYLTQLNQARAMAFGIERFRALAPYCMGTIVWQLNDCWPVTSWAAIDGQGRRKPLWYALRRVYADRLLTVQDGAVAVVNDSAEPWAGELELLRLGLTGEPLAKETVRVEVAPRSVARIPIPEGVATPGNPAAELLAARLGEHRVLEFFAEDPEVDFPVAAYETEVIPSGDGLDVTITARTVLRDLALFPDRLDPASSVDDMLLTLLPGESVTLHVTGSPDPAALVARPVLRCVND